MKFRLLLCLILTASLCSCTIGDPSTTVDEQDTSESAETPAQGEVLSPEQIFQSVLEDQRKIYLPETGEMYLGEFIQDNEFSLSKYSVIDLNDDGSPEMVLSLPLQSNTDEGTLILHCDNDVVYAHLFWYRAFNTLKNDGTFMYSGGAMDHGIAKIDFSDDSYILKQIAYCESVYDGTDYTGENYFIEDQSSTEEEFNEYIDEHFNKADIEWNDLSTAE